MAFSDGRACKQYFRSFYKKNKKNLKIAMVEFQQQIPQRLIDEYGYMNGRNNRLDLRLKLLQREYYFIEDENSYVKLCNTL